MPPRLRLSLDSYNKWSRRETRQLIAAIKSQLTERDPLAYSRRIQILNWQQISIPSKSTEECKSRLESIIKNIPRTRTLEEILSVVDDDPADVKQRKSSAEFSIAEGIKKEIKESDIVIERKNRLPTKSCFKRKSKRLCSGNQQCAKELTPERSYLTPFMLFKKFNSSKYTNKDSLKERYNTLNDIEKLFWIRKTITSASEDDRIENILTEEEIDLLRKELKLDKADGAKIVRGKENKLPNVNLKKRKREENDATIGSLNKKIRIVKENRFDINNRLDEEMYEPKQIKTKSVANEIAVVLNDECTDVEPLCISSSEMEVQNSSKNDVSEMSPVNERHKDRPLREELLNRNVEIPLGEERLIDNQPCCNPSKDASDTSGNTEKMDEAVEPGDTCSSSIETPVVDLPALTDDITMTNTNITTVKGEQSPISIKPSIKEEPEYLKIKAIKQEVREPRRVYSRIKNFCGGLVGRIGNWLRD